MLRLYEHSLGLAFVGLFLLSWAGHALGGFREFENDSVAHGGSPRGWGRTSDSAIRRNRNLSTPRMPRQGDDVSSTAWLSAGIVGF